jgi:hypothetical protein
MPPTKREWIDHLQSIITQLETACNLCPYCAEEHPYQCLWCAPVYLAADSLTNQVILMERHTDVDSHRDERPTPLSIHRTSHLDTLRHTSDSPG